MDFTKFVSLLKEESLFFSDYKEFDDPYEGNFPFGNLLEISQTFKSVNRIRVEQKYDELYITDDEALELSRKDIQELKEIIDRNPHIVSCWHMNKYESAAMWNIYSELDKGIAIQSTFGRLKESFLDSEHDIAIGKVKYLDFEKQKIKWGSKFYTYRLFLYKRKSFRHENEIRAVISVPREKFDVKLKGKNIHVDLKKLIEDIYVSPKSKDWFCGLVQSVAEKYDIHLKVHRSTLNEAPAYLK